MNANMNMIIILIIACMKLDDGMVSVIQSNEMKLVNEF
jgi:hypothetical protein